MADISQKSYQNLDGFMNKAKKYSEPYWDPSRLAHPPPSKKRRKRILEKKNVGVFQNKRSPGQSETGSRSEVTTGLPTMLPSWMFSWR
jgi:hypothetical protein